LAYIFLFLSGFFGATPIFQTNQMIQATKDIVLTPLGVAPDMPYLDLGLRYFYLPSWFHWSFLVELPE